MSETLSAEQMKSGTDPSVANQWDYDTPQSEQITDLYKMIDGMKTGLLTTQRPGIGPVSRSMVTAKRQGPDVLFIANINSQKFKDLEHSKNVQVTFQDLSTQNWVSMTGTATTASNSDPRIKELYNVTLKAWFGDVGDGKHDGGPEDPRIALIEVQPKYIAYWKTEVSTLGFVKELALGAMTGKLANTGLNREFKEADIQKMRQSAQH